MSDPVEREYAGNRKASRFTGDTKRPAQRMTMHWVHCKQGRMYWCQCMPSFRVGASVHHPRMVKGQKAK